MSVKPFGFILWMTLEKKKEKRNNGVWGEAMVIFSQISTWIVVPIVLALVVGKSLDARFDTRPWIFLSLALAGFLFSIFGIYRIIIKYVEEIKVLGEENKDK